MSEPLHVSYADPPFVVDGTLLGMSRSCATVGDRRGTFDLDGNGMAGTVTRVEEGDGYWLLTIEPDWTTWSPGPPLRYSAVAPPVNTLGNSFAIYDIEASR